MNLNNTHKLCSIVAFVLITLLLGTNVSAGRIRDKIRERRKERVSEKLRDKLTNEDDTPLDPSLLPEGINDEVNIPYGTENKQHFDIYYPSFHIENAPVLFMVHGGGWRIGDKAMTRVVVNKVKRWVPKGFIFISTNYRMVPDLDPIGQATDVVLAIAKAQEEVHKWGGDPNKFVLMGHSAGAHLVSLIATDDSLSHDIVMTPWLGTVSLDSAAYDVERIMRNPHLPLYDQAFGEYTDAYWREASPFYAINSDTKPILSVYSTRRKDSYTQAKRFAAKAVALGVKVELLGKDMSHGEINSLLGEDQVYTQEVEVFMADLNSDIEGLLFDGTLSATP